MIHVERPNSYTTVKAYRNYSPLLTGILIMLILVFFAILGFTSATSQQIKAVQTAVQPAVQPVSVVDKPTNTIEDETPGVEFKWVKVRNLGGRVVSIRRVSVMMRMGDIISGDDGQKVKIIGEEFLKDSLDQ